MLPTLRSPFDRLERQRHALLDELLAHTPAQLAFIPAPRSWSLAALIQHLVLVDEGTLRFLTLKAPRPANGRTLVHRLRWMALKLAGAGPIRVKAPNAAIIPAEDVPVETLVARWEAARAALESHLEGITESQLDLLVFKHPIAGPLPIIETLEFLELHLIHHGHQIRRIRGAPGWPAAAPTVPPASAIA